MNKYKLPLFLTLFSLILFGLGRLYYYLTDDFHLRNISHPPAMNALWTPPSRMESSLHPLFEQTFTYLGKGAQAYAFVSEDKNYVIKFFKFKHLRPTLFVELLPEVPPLLSYKESVQERKMRKLLSVFNGYEVAHKKNRDHSKILYLHLLPTHFNLPVVKLIDKAGRLWMIDLDQVVFLVQRKGETLENRLKNLLELHQVEAAAQAINQTIEMILDEYKRGLVDFDHSILINTGFVGKEAFHLDVGQLTEDPRVSDPKVYRHQLKKMVWSIDQWIQKKYPFYQKPLRESMVETYKKATGEGLDFDAIDPQLIKQNRRALILENP